jgi:hypothetical protein
MPDQAQTLKIVIVNQSGQALVTTLTPEAGEAPQLNFALESGTLDGATSPPLPIPDGQTASFSTTTPAGSPFGPQGWVCYEIAPYKIVMRIVWSDPAAAQGADIVSVIDNQLGGATGELDIAPVTLTDASGAALTPDAAKTASTITATITVKVKGLPSTIPPPQPGVANVPVAGAPGGSGGVSLPTLIKKWDDPAMAQNGRRRKILAAIANLFPLAFFKDVPQPDGSMKPNVTGGPGDSHGGGKYAQMTFWTSTSTGTSCTSTTIAVANLCKAQNKKWWAWGALELDKDDKKNPWKPPKCWVPWGSDPARPMPQVGDVYVLYRDIIGPNPKTVATDNPALRHCGFVLQVPDDENGLWVTADGGQRNASDKDNKQNQAAFLNTHSWKLATPGSNVSDQEAWKTALKAHPFAQPIDGITYPFFGGGAESAAGLNMADANRLIGWIDMSSPDITMDESFSTAPKVHTPGRITEDDYKDLGARIALALANPV